jgi:hypothetical protein
VDSGTWQERQFSYVFDKIIEKFKQMSELKSRFVHRGYWVDEAKGPILGQIITTDAGMGTLIIALLAVLTSIGLNHFWHLLTYFITKRGQMGRLQMDFSTATGSLTHSSNPEHSNSRLNQNLVCMARYK